MLILGAMIDQMPNVPETLPIGNLDKIEALLRVKNPWENDEDIKHILEIAQSSGDEFQKQLLRHLVNQPNLVGGPNRSPVGGVPPEIDDTERLRQVIYTKFPGARKEAVEKHLLRLHLNGDDINDHINRHMLGGPPSPFDFDFSPSTESMSPQSPHSPPRPTQLPYPPIYPSPPSDFRFDDTPTTTESSPSSGRPSVVSSLGSLSDEEYYNDPVYESLTNALNDSIRPPPRRSSSIVTNRLPPPQAPQNDILDKPNITQLRPRRPPPINTKPTSERFPPVNYSELSSGASTPKTSPESSDEKRERLNAKRRAKYAKDKAVGKVRKKRK